MTTTIKELPLYDEPGGFLYGTDLEGQAKQLEFYWNSRSAQWHMNIRNEDQTEVVMGVALVADYPMLAEHPMEEFGLTGYFLLLSNVIGDPGDISASSSIVPQFFDLMYVYVVED